MMWGIEIFSEESDRLLGWYALNSIAADAVERILGEDPERPTPVQIAKIAPLFDLDPHEWSHVTEPTDPANEGGLDWLDMALLPLLCRMTGGTPVDHLTAVFPLTFGQAQDLLDRFSARVSISVGELDVSWSGSLTISEAQALLQPFAWARDKGLTVSGESA